MITALSFSSKKITSFSRGVPISHSYFSGSFFLLLLKHLPFNSHSTLIKIGIEILNINCCIFSDIFKICLNYKINHSHDIVYPICWDRKDFI